MDEHLHFWDDLAIWQSRVSDMQMLWYGDFLSTHTSPFYVPAGSTDQERGILVVESSPSRYVLSDS